MEEKIEEEKRSNCKELSARRDQPGGFISRPISGKKEVKSQEGMQAAASALPQTENK